MTRQQSNQIKHRLRQQGHTLKSWAEAHQFKYRDVSDVVRGVRPAGLRRPLFYVVSWLQSEQAVLSLLECGVDQYMAFPLSLQRLRGKVSNDLNRLL